MADSPQELTEDERKELEELRELRKKQLEDERAAAEREELMRLRRQVADTKKDSEKQKRIEHAKQQGKELMEPDEELHMPTGQKVVLILLFVIVVASIFALHFN